MLTKIYKATGYNNIVTYLQYKKMRVHVEFKDGNATSGVPARLTTSDPFVQYVVEHDPNYGVLFTLERAIGCEDPEIEEPAPAKKKPVKKSGNSVPGVKDLSEAIDWFAENGIECTTKQEVIDAMKSENVEFPNLKL